MIENNRKQKKIETQFSITIMFITFAVFGISTTIQMNILGKYIDYRAIPLSTGIIIIVFWLIMAVLFTLITRDQVIRRYERPLRQFADATKQVANGDFSVYVKPIHTPNRLDYIDVMFINFNKMVEALGSIETLKTDFFSSVSHEIKTPISIIHNYAELLKNTRLDEETRQEYVQIIYSATRRLSDLITNMLKLNKLEKQTIQLESEPYDICEQLCECILQYENLWDSKNIEIEVDIEDTALIEADESLMELVWSNILSNAVKFTDEGGKISVRQVSTGDEIVVEISDTGCGMDSSTIQHIFDRFYQGDNSRSSEGNGLGLALVSRILELMNGHISVDSTVGKGTTFSIRIPAVRK